MALSAAEASALSDLYDKWTLRKHLDNRHYEYVTLERKIEQLGMAIPAEMRRFLVMLGWPRLVVETIAKRQKVSSLMRPGDVTADSELLRVWDANNLTAHTKMWRRDRYTFGRAFMSVGSRVGTDMPLVRVESPREIEADVDVRLEEMRSAARFYGTDDVGQPEYATLYTPGYTKWLAKDRGRWAEIGVDDHKLGRVPLVMSLNRRWSGDFGGESELTEIIPLTDAAIRSLTNMQFGQEAHGVPGIWATGVTQKDFVGADGKPLSQFEAYYDVIKMLSDPNGKWGQFTAADLKNFETALRLYGSLAATVTGFPAHMFGITTANPSSEGAIVADEVDLVNTIEDKNESEAVELGWVMGLAERFRTGQWVEDNQIKVEHHNPATPTIAQREDALQKRRASGALSVEGYWDELGWSEPRKAKEREYLAAERRDPQLDDLADRLIGESA